MTADRRTFTIFLTIGGCGNHLVKDFLKSLDIGFAPAQMVDFWACWVQARHCPEQPTISDWFPDLSARDAVEAYMRRFGAPEGGDALDFDTAAAAFAKGLEAIGNRRLFTHHLFPFLISYRRLKTAGGFEVPWPIDFAREAMEALERGLDTAGWQRRTVMLVRHPLDVFLSNRDRFGADLTDDELVRQVVEFGEAVDGHRGKPHTVLCRYEDVCRKDPATLRMMLDMLGLETQRVEDCRLDILYAGEVAKYQSLPRPGIRALAETLAAPLRHLGYGVDIPGRLAWGVLWMRKRLGRWRSEKANYDKVFAGDFTPAAAILRHKRSLIIKLYWQLNMLVPSRRTNYISFYRQETGSELPTPRLERPIRRLLGLKVTE